MTPESDTVTELQTPPAALPVEADAASQAPDQAPAETVAPPQDAETTGEPAAPKTLLEAAMSALGKSDEQPAAAAMPAEQPKDEAPTSAPDVDDAPANAPDGTLIPADEFKALPKTAKDAIKALRKEAKTLRVDADRGVAVARFMQTSQISPSEYAELLDVGALLKTDPAKAREVLIQRVAAIDAHLGNTLPADLREEVDSGYIAEERAKELSQARARTAHLERSAEAQHAAAQQNAVLSDIAAWEAKTSQTDADFARKQPMLLEKTRLRVLERQMAGTPVTTGAEAVEIVRQAYASVNETMRSFAPVLVATRPTPKSAASAPAASTAPKTIYEAAMAAVGLR